MSTKEKEETSKAATREAPAQQPAEPAPPPETRYFTTSVDVVCSVANDDVTSEGVEAAAKEQIGLPTSLSISTVGGLVNAPVLGATLTGSDESKEAEWEAGFGREASPSDEAEAKK